MKKISLIIAIVAFTLIAKSQTTVNYPSAPASVVTPSVTAKAIAQPLVVSNTLTFYNLGTIDTNKTLTITAASVSQYAKAWNIPIGTEIVVYVTCDATGRTITSSTGLTCSVITLTASKSHTITYRYNGTTFLGIATIKTLQ